MQKHTLLILTVVFLGFSCATSPKSEIDLIAMLDSRDPQDVIDALDRLPDTYPDSDEAVGKIRSLLHVETRVEGYPPNIVSRRAARALGDYGATLDLDEVRLIFRFLQSPDANEAMDGLKSLRGLKEPPEVVDVMLGQVIPLLRDEDDHVVRDACKTLAMIGNKGTVKHLEPLLQDRRRDVKRDAQLAINRLMGVK